MKPLISFHQSNGRRTKKLKKFNELFLRIFIMYIKLVDYVNKLMIYMHIPLRHYIFNILK